jgi:hypothetical protein
MYLFAVTLFSLLLLLCGAAPILDSANVKPMDWGPTPMTRGTLTILFSCAAALAACVWTGVHLNVDRSGSKRMNRAPFGKLTQKTVLATIALLAPDIVLSIALHQFLVAYEYQRAVNKYLALGIHTEEDVLERTRNQPKTWLSTFSERITPKCLRENKSIPNRMKLKVAFFALMGGFSVEQMAISGPSWDSIGVGVLCRHETMEKIYNYPMEEILDKSKANGLEKLFAIVQTGWILLQCFGRSMEGIHITNLELNTVVHVLLAIVMYGIWWEKPADINKSISMEQFGLREEDNSATTVYVDLLRQTLDKAEAEISPRILGLASVAPSKTSDEKPRSPFIEYREMVAAIAVLRSINECPDEAERRFKAIPEAIKHYFTRAVRRDVKWAVLNHVRMLPEIPPQIQLAACTAAFATAHREANNLVSEGVVFSVQRVFVNHLAKDLDKTLDEIVQSTTNGLIAVTLESALKAAYEANEKIPSPIHETPLIVAVRAARAASRTAARRAIFSTLLNLAMGPQGAGNAAANAFLQKASVCSRLSEEQRTFIKDDIEESAQHVRKNVIEAYKRHFQKVGIGRRNDNTYAAEIVHRATATAIYFAGKAKVKQAVQAAKNIADPDTRNGCLLECGKAQKLLKMLSSPEDMYALNKVRVYLHGLVDIISHQIVQVPGLFWPVSTSIPYRRESTDTMDSNNSAYTDSVFSLKWRTWHWTFLLIFSSAAGAFYGSIHASTWNSKWFPTETEHQLWRISCCIGSCAVVPIALLFMIPFISTTKQEARTVRSASKNKIMSNRLIGAPLRQVHNAVPSDLNKWLKNACKVLCVLAWVVFIAARMFIVIESFISLRSLPPDAFESVNWTMAIPHI